MSAGLPFLQQIIGVLAATSLVLIWALLVRHARQTPGRHRPDHATAEPDVFDQVLALTEPDDWTADLPTSEIHVVLDEPDPEVIEGVRMYLQYRAERDERRRRQELSVTLPLHTSPSERARQRWGVECPIFAQLADELGYDSARGFEAELVAA